MPDQSHQDAASGLGIMGTMLAATGVLYYVLFAGVGVEIQRDLSTVAEDVAADTEADPSLSVAQN